MSQIVTNSYRYAECEPIVFEQAFTADQNMAGGMYGITYSQSGTRIDNVGTGQTLIGQEVNKVSFDVGVLGSPTGTIYARVYEMDGDPNAPSGDNYRYEYGSMSVGSWGTSTIITFENTSDNYTIANGDVHALWFNGGDTNNRVYCRGKAPVTVSGLAWTEYNTSEDWNLVTNSQGWIKLEKPCP